MSADAQTPEKRRPSVRWLILGGAVTFAILACATAVVVVMLYRSNVPLVMGAATIAGVSLEVLLWTSAGVFGWGFLAKRREALGRWKRKLFSPKSEAP
jgi:uncharacterized membrane protein